MEIPSRFDDGLIDRIYEAAVIPELWPDVLDRLSAFADCYGGTFFAVDAQREVRYLVSETMRDLMNAFVAGGWNQRNIRFERLMPKKYPGFVMDLDVMTREEIDAHPYYTEFVRPNGGGWAAGTVIGVPTGDYLVFNLERRHDDGPITRATCESLDGLRPHLARASLMSARLRLERARLMTKTLELLGLPAAVLRSNGRALAVNQLFEALHKQLTTGAFDRVALTNSSSDRLFREGLEQLTADGNAAPRSIPLPAIDEFPPSIVHLVPIKRSAADIFARAGALLLVTPLAAPSAPTEDVLNGLFDLTPAEVRVTQGIVGGKTVETLADSLSVSRETVRSQLKSVMLKVGVSRQAELVGLLASAGILG